MQKFGQKYHMKRCLLVPVCMLLSAVVLYYKITPDMFLEQTEMCHATQTRFERYVL